MVQNYLLTYEFENEQGACECGFAWNDTLYDLKEDISRFKDELKEFTVIEIIKIISAEILDEYELV